MAAKVNPKKFKKAEIKIDDKMEDITSIINDKISNVRTKTLDLSFNEILDMYLDKEFIITPDYQRLFRWSEGKQSRFIESLILEMPIPPLYAIETKEGQYELIDGLQRISSYLNFRGVLPKAEESEELEGTELKIEKVKKKVGRSKVKKSDNAAEAVGSLVLQECDIVPELNNYSYEKLPSSLKIRLKRSFVRVEVLRKENEIKLKYYMFKRLNTGGEKLSDQEIRNCTIRLADSTFYDFIMRMSNEESFKTTISSIPEEKISKKYDHELILRFFAFKNWMDKYKKDVGDFITEYMESVSGLGENIEKFNYAEEEAIFKKTFLVLDKTLGEFAFAKFGKKGKFVSVFIVYHFEALVLGLQKYLPKIDLTNKDQIKKIKEVLTALKGDDSFKVLVTGGGKNTHVVLKQRVAVVENALKKIF